MIDWDSALGRRTLQRIMTEQIIWLTTVSSNGIPQPRPVWFVWDGNAFLIYSTPQAKKIQHIAGNPNVALHFNTDASGEDIQVILGKAHIDPIAPASNQNAAYSKKYYDGILALGMDAEKYSTTFSTALYIIPSRLRGLDPIPEL